jgi:hypothetical protein
MKFGFKKNDAKNSAPATLFAQCERLYAVNRSLVQEDQDGCADLVLDLKAPAGAGTCRLVRHSDPSPYYGLFPPEGVAGHGSFIYPDGTFEQHGRIGEDKAVRIIATFTPAGHR